MLTRLANDVKWLRAVTDPSERDPAAGPTARQRALLRRCVGRRVPLLRHRVEMLANGIACVDPESALSSVESIARECASILAAARRVLA